MSNPTGSAPPPRRDAETAGAGNAAGTPPTQGGTPEPRRESDEVERLLADARVRVQQTLDESMARAEELLSQRWGAVRGRLVAEVQRTLADLADLLDGMEAVRNRMLRIEALLQEHEPTEEAPAESPESGRRLASVPPLPARPDRPSLSVVAPGAEAPEGSTKGSGPGPSTAGSPRLDAGGGAAAAPATASATAPRLDEPESATESSEPAVLTDDAFQPDGGPVQMRIDPVSGFQELMRIQQVLGGIDGVDRVAIEAYEQGEARLRLELSDPTRPRELATGLGKGLEQDTEVRSASAAERTLRITLRSA